MDSPGMKYVEIAFESAPLEVPEDSQFGSLFGPTEATADETEKRVLITELVVKFKQDKTNREMKYMILNLFSKYNFRKALKKFLQDLIVQYDVYLLLLTRTKEEILKGLKDKKYCNVKTCTDLFNFVTVMQNTKVYNYDATIERLFAVYHIIFEGFVYHVKNDYTAVTTIFDELCALLNIVLKQFLPVMVKPCDSFKALVSKLSPRFVVLSSMVMNKMVSFDLQSKAGLVFVHSYNNLPEAYKQNFEYKDCPAVELLKNITDGVLLGDNRTSDSIVIVYSSIFHAVPQEKLFKETINGKLVISVLYEYIIECAKSKTSIPHVIVEASHTLSNISKQLKNVPENAIKPLFINGISYAWSHIDHFIDTVRTYAKLFLNDLVSLAVYHHKNDYPELLEILLENIKDLKDTQMSRLLVFENLATHNGSSYILKRFTELPDSLLGSLSETVVAEQVCKTYSILMKKQFEITAEEEWTALWVLPVVKLLKTCKYCTPVCHNIISQAFQLHPGILRKIFPNGYVETPQDCAMLLKCLRYARNYGIEVSMDNTEDSSLYWKGLIDKSKLVKFMVLQDDEIRLSALAVIVECKKSTELFSYWEFTFLSKYIHYNIVSQIPNIQKQVISLYKKALMRFKAGYYSIERNINGLKKKLKVTKAEEESDVYLQSHFEVKEYYDNFITNFTKQLVSNLTFDANYLRRATSLELLLFIEGIMPKDDWLKCWTSEDIKNCHHIVFDTYESNKKLAVRLLKSLPLVEMGFTNINFTLKYLQESVSMARAMKPSENLSGAYLLEICALLPHFSEIEEIETVKTLLSLQDCKDPIVDMIAVVSSQLVFESLSFDISNAKVSMYGLLLGIRHLLQIRNMNVTKEAFSSFFRKLVKTCINLSYNIMPVVCNPSPEGYLPEIDDIIPESKESSKAQMILVYAWRTMKEMTLLLAEIVRQCIKLEKAIQLLSQEVFEGIGNFFISIFIGSKHRGVFEQAYIGFSVMCESFWTSSNAELNKLPMVWLKGALEICTGEKYSDQLSATRRSCGLPFLILAVISSEPTLDKSKFQHMITTLFNCCKNTSPENTEYRMHSMNVLRATFRHSRLGEVVAPYVANAVIIAVKNFSSDDWGIRNSATLLYSSLITRIFGVQRTQDSVDLCVKNKLTVKVFYMRYPQLLEFLLDTLAEECSKNDSLILHPILMILARLYPSHMEEYNLEMQKFFVHLETCLSNQVYRTRDLAARASIPLIQADKVSSRFNDVFYMINKEDVGDNECHGLLLQVLHILKSCSLPEAFISDYIRNSKHILTKVGTRYSHMTASLYLEVILLFLTKYNDYNDLDCLKDITLILSKQMRSNSDHLTSKSRYPQMRLTLMLYITINKFEENDLTFSTNASMLMCQLYGNDSKMKQYCLNLLIYLNQVLKKQAMANYALEDELQIPPEIITLVNSFDHEDVQKLLTFMHQHIKCFLTEEIKFQHYVPKNDQMLLFVLAEYYPCVIKSLNVDKQDTLNMLVNLCNCDNEELISAIISCISTFLLEVDYSVLKYNTLLKVLMESAAPAAMECRRLAASEFLAKNCLLYCNKQYILNGEELQMILNIIMVLFEDDDLLVRNSMSTLATCLEIRLRPNSEVQQTLCPIIPEKTREDLLRLASVVLQRDRAICFLCSWACRHFSVTEISMSAVYEKGELNIYSENVPIMRTCASLLYTLLWPLEDGLSYEDKSIFVEEQTLIVTTLLLDSLIKYPSPMMANETKVSVVCALKSIVRFLENYEVNNDNFAAELKNYLNETIGQYLAKHISYHEFFNVRWLLKNIYDPVVNPSAVRDFIY